MLDLPVLDDAAFAPAAGTAPAHDVSPLVDLLDEPAPRALDASSAPSSAHGHAAPVERVDDTYVDLASWLAEDEGPKTTRMTADEAFETGDESGDFDRMLSTFRDGVARTLDADDYQAHYDMGLAFRGMGLLDDAISEFQKAVRAPNRPLRTVEALGECFLERGQPQVALTVLERGLASTPAAAPADDALLGVLYFLGRAQEALDRPAEALGCYQRVLATDIQFRDAAERLAQLTRTTR
jgi:tetratricopeptide (TPR) repeat protein